jgi:GAF domain-containing protein
VKHRTDTHEIAARALLAETTAEGRPEEASASPISDVDLSALEADASAGCSICARALVNAREAAVDLALTAAPAVPGAALRDRVLADGRARRPSNRPPPKEEPADSSTTVARKHVTGPDEAERLSEVARLTQPDGSETEGCQRVLVQVQQLIDFPVLFVGILRGERVENRVRLGAPPELDSTLADVPREMTFCTHCVSAGEALVVENAAREPFFRGGAMVRDLGVGAYVGVPLVSARGVAFGTLCALDRSARRVTSDDVRAMEVFAAPVVAALERRHEPRLRDQILECTMLGREVYRLAWFDRLLGVELARAARGRASALIAIKGASAHDVGGLAETREVVGRLDQHAIGVLLSGVTPEAAAPRVEHYRRALPSADVRVATADLHFAELLRARSDAE